VTQLAIAAPRLRSNASARRRRSKNAMLTTLLVATVLIAIGVLAWVLIYVAIQGVGALSPSFVTHNPPGDPAAAGGGFSNGIMGSLIVVGIAAGIAIPLGVGAAIYLVEYGHGPAPRLIRFVNDILIGIPTIVTGAFVYAIWVTRFGFSGFAGSLALAIVMLPLVTRTTEEMLRLVPNDLREGSLALGATRSQTILRICIPTALPGIITGAMLAVARAMGETAPLLLTALGNELFTELNPGKRMSTLSLQIFDNAVTGFKEAQSRAWAGALTLVAIVLILTFAARYFGRRVRTTENS
jgi:phosphate transport system permease protein